MPTLKPIDAPAICRIAAEGKAILTVEEHSVIGGLGGAVAEVLAQRAPAVPFRILGIPDSFAREVGGQEHLKRVNRLSVPDIVRSALELSTAPRRRGAEFASKGSESEVVTENPETKQESEGRRLSVRICPQARRAREAALRSRPSTERNEASGQRRRSNRPLFCGVLY